MQYECENCSRKFSSKSLYKRHICGKTFKTVKDLELYDRINKTDDVAMYEEEISDFKSKRIRRKKSEIISKYFCDICSKGFVRKYDMEKHRKSKHPEQPDTEYDSRVEKTDRNRDLLRRSRYKTADGEEYYKCEVCDKIITRSYNFMRHQSVHTGVRKYCCHICGNSFRLSGILSRHIQEFHLRIKNLSCDICSRKFSSKQSLQDHKLIHSNERSFVCDICNSAFKQKSALRIHKLFHSDNFPFVCTVCGKKYRRARDLKVHSWIHTGNRPYSCEVCNSRFRLSQDLKRHMKTHGNMEFHCDECGSKFSQLRYLNNHQRKHEKSKVD